jgi:tetratricopeptide (TPR) repeat protein
MRIKGLVLVLLACGATAQAETLRVDNYTPARSDALVVLREIQVDALGGNVGPAMAVLIEDRLRAIDYGQGPWFRVIPAPLGGGGDAVFRGTADIDVERFDRSETRERCVKDSQNKCTDQKEKYQVSCIRREFSLETRLRLIGRNGELLWADDSSEPHSENRCSDQSGYSRGPRDIERLLIGRVVARIETDMVPRQAVTDVRVDENRRALEKDDAEQFKRAVRHVRDGQPNEACALWTQLGERYPAHQPTRFNLGLCAEFIGKTSDARARYLEVLKLNPAHSAASTGIGRLNRRELALRQLEMRDAG